MEYSRTWGKLIHEKSLTKISCQSPFNFIELRGRNQSFENVSAVSEVFLEKNYSWLVGFGRATYF
jgi:hypothetical protein